MKSRIHSDKDLVFIRIGTIRHHSGYILIYYKIYKQNPLRTKTVSPPAEIRLFVCLFLVKKETGEFCYRA